MRQGSLALGSPDSRLCAASTGSCALLAHSHRCVAVGQGCDTACLLPPAPCPLQVLTYGIATAAVLRLVLIVAGVDIGEAVAAAVVCCCTVLHPFCAVLSCY